MEVFEGDIRGFKPEVIASEVGIAPGELDVLVGGPPCQAFSTAGRRKSVEDPRGELLWDFLDFIIALQPKVFVMENVRGLLSAALRHRPIAERPDKGGPPLEPAEEPGSVVDLWVDDLLRHTEGQYRVDCFEVNAVNYGAPQLRERAVFIGNRLGVLTDFPSPRFGLVESDDRSFKGYRLFVPCATQSATSRSRSPNSWTLVPERSPSWLRSHQAATGAPCLRKFNANQWARLGTRKAAVLGGGDG